jgi:hypothetical protein
MTTTYTSVKAVLHDLSLLVDERYWNEMAMEEWITKALRQLNIEPALEQTVALIPVVEHKALLPKDLKYLTQVSVRTHQSPDDLHEIISQLELPNPQLDWTKLTTFGWTAMRLASNPFHDSICLDESLTNCKGCAFEFTVSPSLVLTTNAHSGLLLVAYLRHPIDEDGSALIPDDETLKEAILHYALYRYWLLRYVMKEDGADTRMRFHLQMWDTLSKKAQNLNLPDLSQIENIRRQRSRLVPRSRQFANHFTTLNNEEHVSH